ncbi:MAG TPA: hydrogenase accessory protein HypB [bacterium]|nr:hydrogenase accessory protein HypB [bacterium]
MAEIKVFESIMNRNNALAEKNKKLLKGALVINLMSSPGAGKTSLLEKSLKSLSKKYRTGVIEGDIATSNDADRIKRHLSPSSVYQIKTENYGGGCHLDSKMIAKAVKAIKADKKPYDIIIIENVGNLICPADFYLGEDKKVVMLSVTEGDDKPLKYPGMFAAADLVILSKTDLLKHLDFSLKKAEKYIRKVNKKTLILNMSVKKNEGMKQWLGIMGEWVKRKRALF